MSDWNLGRVFRIGVAYVVGVYTGNWAYLASQLMRERGSVQRNKQTRRAQQQYNDSLQNRFEMLDLQPNAPRSIVLGRVRHVEGVRDRWTSGTHEENLTLIVSFAGHEIDAFEQFYLNDLAVTLDGDGWVNEAPYRKSVAVAYDIPGTLDGSGEDEITLPETPTGTPTVVWYTGTGEDRVEGTASVSMDGADATITGGQPGASYFLGYVGNVGRKLVRIRPYLGTSTQNLYTDLNAEYPGKLSSGDAFKGIALAVMDVVYDTDTFPQGRPTLTAVMRGAKCLDPRDDTTAWTRNPAILAYHHARLAYGGMGLSTGNLRTTDFEDAADVCDTEHEFTLRLPDDSTDEVTLPLYQCDMVYPSDADPGEVLDAIVDAMAGRHAWAGPELRIRAGTLNATATTITQDWLVNTTGNAGVVDKSPVISAVQSIKAKERYNRVSGTCVDQSQRYQLLPFPAVEDSVLVAAKGVRLLEVEYATVAHIAHAQHLASIAIREAQAGLRLELSLDERAADLEVLDVVALDMDEYGYESNTFEVTGWQWQADGAYAVRLSEITAEMYEPQAELTGRDPAPDSTIREPWDVEQLEGLSVTSGTTATLDGSVLTRTVVEWDAAVGETIRRGGQVEIQYWPASDAQPAGDWPVWMEAGTATQAVIPGLLAGRYYLFKARFVQPLPLVRGAFSSPLVLHEVASVRASTIFRQTTAPTGDVQDDDHWFDTDDGNKHYVRSGGSWVEVSDGNKVTTFVQTSAPTAAATGDLWLDTDDGNKLYRWSGSAWVALPVGTGGIEPGAATTVVVDNEDHAGASFGTTTVQSFAVTPEVDSVVEFTAKVTADNILGDSGNVLRWYVTPSGGGDTLMGGSETNSTAKQEFTAANAFSATGGVELTFSLRTTVSGPSIHVFTSYMRATVIKR